MCKGTGGGGGSNVGEGSELAHSEIVIPDS